MRQLLTLEAQHEEVMLNCTEKKAYMHISLQMGIIPSKM